MQTPLRGPTLPLLAFQHHVGPLHIDPVQLEFLVELSSSSDLAIVELARFALLPSGKPIKATVKVFRPFVVATPADFRELLLEASMLHRLAHPHIARFYGLGCFRHGSLAEVRESMFMVEEYVGSRTLRKLLSEQGRCRVKNLYDMRTALRWAAQVASALCALHEQSPPYVHNDVKADNVFLTDGRIGAAVAKLGDLKPHRHVYDREPSTLSHHQQQQRQQLAKQGRQSSLARYSLERSSADSSTSAGGAAGASGGGSIPACRLLSIGAGRLLWASSGSDDAGSSPATVSNISSSSGGVGQHHQQLPPPSVLLPAGGHGSCWTAAEDGSWSSCGAAALVAAADAPDGDAASAACDVSVARLRSLPVPIGSSRSGHVARSASCSEEWGSATYGTAASACASTTSMEVGSASSSFFSASSHGCRSRGSSLSAAGSGSLAGLSDVLSPASAPPHGNSLAAEIARADAAAATAAAQADAAGEDEAAAAAADGAADGTDSLGGGGAGRGLSFRRLRSKTLRLSDSASSTGDGGDGAAAAQAKSRVMSLSAAIGDDDPALATAEAGSEAAAVQECVEHNSSLPAGALAAAMGKQQQAPTATGSGGLPFLQVLLHKQRTNSTDALGEAAGASPLHGARSAPTAMFDADDASLEGAVHDGGLLALQPAMSAPASALAALQQPQPQQELRKHIAARLLKQQAAQQAVPHAAFAGWELSRSGAANPCGSAQCSMLDLFADLTDEEAATSRRYRDSSQYTLVPGSFVHEHKVVPSPRLASVQSAPAVSGRTAGGSSGCNSSSSWEVAASMPGSGKWSSSAVSTGACGSPSQQQQHQEQQLLLAMQQLERAQAAICKGSAPSAIESKQHGGNSAFAALTAIDCITEESSSMATDSCAPSRESTAHGGGHFYEDAGTPKDQQQLQQQPGGSLQSLLSSSSLQKALSLNALTRRMSSGSAVATDGDAGGSLAQGHGSPHAGAAAGAAADSSRPIHPTGAGCTPPASLLAQQAAGQQDSFGSDASPAAAAGAGVGSPFAAGMQQCSDAASTTPVPAASSSPAAKRVRFALERPEGATASRDYSLLYAAPELMRGERPTEKVDVFAFGIVLLELLSRTLVVNHCAEVCSHNAAATSSRRGSRHAKDASSRSRGGCEGDACPPEDRAAGVAVSAHSSSADSSADGDAAAPHQQQVLLAYAQAVACGARPRLPPHFPARVAALIHACWAAEPHERPRMCDVLVELQAWSRDRKLVAALDDFVLGLADLGISPAQQGCGCTIS